MNIELDETQIAAVENAAAIIHKHAVDLARAALERNAQFGHKTCKVWGLSHFANGVSLVVDAEEVASELEREGYRVCKGVGNGKEIFMYTEKDLDKGLEV